MSRPIITALSVVAGLAIVWRLFVGVLIREISNE